MFEGTYEECSRKRGQHIELKYSKTEGEWYKLRLRDPSKPWFSRIQAFEWLSENLVRILRAMGRY